MSAPGLRRTLSPKTDSRVRKNNRLENNSKDLTESPPKRSDTASRNHEENQQD